MSPTAKKAAKKAPAKKAAAKKTAAPPKPPDPEKELDALDDVGNADGEVGDPTDDGIKIDVGSFEEEDDDE